MKRVRIALVVLVVSMAFLGAQGVKGKSVILVQDVSPSIAPYFPTIQKVLARALIEKRLEVGDYFTLIAFSGKPSIEDGAQIQYSRDVEARKSIWSKIRPEGAGTDIGLALQTALTTTVELRNHGYSNFDPLVIFVTDGDHEPLSGSPFFGKNVENIFADPFIGDKSLYRGWYFVGIGKNLIDIKRIAELTGRSSEFLSIDDPSELEKALDDFIMRIPEPNAREAGAITPLDFSVGGRKLEGKRRVSIPLGVSIPSAMKLVSSYRQTDSVVELKSLSMTFQSADKTAVVDLAPAFEKGRIDVPRSKAISTTASLHPSNLGLLHGPGTLKLELELSDDYIDHTYAEAYEVSFLTPSEAFWNSWGFLILAGFVVVVGFAAFMFLKGFLPVSIVLEVPGSTTKYRSVKLGVGDKAEVGTKPNARFRLEGNFEPIVLTIRRSGKSSWEVVPRAATQVAATEGLKPYRLGSGIKLMDGDGNERSVRFISKSGK